jgi:ABC-type branched-subunit amino acid transport system substrate-binding protein
MGASTASLERPIKLGVVADLTGPMSFMGIADANVARMVVDEINAAGGLLGRHIELHIEDSETIDEAAEAAAAKLVRDVRADVIFGGILSSTRQAIKAAAVTEGRTLYVYPEQYEGQECDPLIFCTGPVPAQQVDPLIPWLIEETGAKRFALPSADYVWPRIMNEKVRQIVTAAGGEIVEEDYYPLDHTDYGNAIEKIMSGGAEVVFNTIVPPAVVPFFQQLHEAGFAGHLVCTYFDENCLNLVPAEQVEGLYSCLDYYRDAEDPFSRELLDRYDKRYPGGAMFTGGGACSGMYRGLARPARGDRGARPRQDRRRSRRAGRDGARTTPRADEHVHRPSPGRRCQDDQAARRDRPRRAGRPLPARPRLNASRWGPETVGPPR